MDTGDDFITSEFLHLLFFEQKNLVIFPYVDLKHLRSVDLFTVGFETVDIDSTVIHNLNEIIDYECNSSYSQLQTLYFILNPSSEELEILVDSRKLRCVINSKENVESLANGDQFVFYNKKNNTFLNYEFEGRDLSFEEEILRSSPTTQAIMDELLKIKSLSSKIFADLNQNNSSDNLPAILGEYDQKYWNKILRFTELYCQIEIPEFNRPIQLPKKQSSSKEIDYSAEYELIIKTNRKLGRSFIQLIHDYRYDRVNPANLEVTQLFYPQKLYNYLRNHHWKNGMPKEFAITWFKNIQKDFLGPEEALTEFQVILNNLRLSYSVSDIDLERKNEPEIKESNRTKKKVSIPSMKQQTETLIIPSIDNFPEFKDWLLSKLTELEKHM
ncbi:MAG: hypothetical protein ACTSP8_02480 [Promethearchaeota archaeon]